jgi:hypothetical protein
LFAASRCSRGSPVNLVERPLRRRPTVCSGSIWDAGPIVSSTQLPSALVLRRRPPHDELLSGPRARYAARRRPPRRCTGSSRLATPMQWLSSAYRAP